MTLSVNLALLALALAPMLSFQARHTPLTVHKSFVDSWRKMPSSSSAVLKTAFLAAAVVVPRVIMRWLETTPSRVEEVTVRLWL